MSALPELKFPLVISEWDRNAREVIRVALDHYQGRHTIDIRVWYHADDVLKLEKSVLKPGKTGITLAVKHLPAIANAMAKALDEARELGLLVDDGGAQ
jgi:Transcriptional Coactivator p15 (PC4)